MSSWALSYSWQEVLWCSGGLRHLLCILPCRLTTLAVQRPEVPRGRFDAASLLCPALQTSLSSPCSTLDSPPRPSSRPASKAGSLHCGGGLSCDLAGKSDVAASASGRGLIAAAQPARTGARKGGFRVGGPSMLSCHVLLSGRVKQALHHAPRPGSGTQAAESWQPVPSLG